MIGTTNSGEAAKPSPGRSRNIGRFFEILTVGSLGAGLLLLSSNPWYSFWAVLIAFATGVVAYCCALYAKLEESQAILVEKPFGTSDRYLIDSTNLEKMTADGVPWDVVGTLARLIECQPSSSPDAKSPDAKSPDAKSTELTEVQLIQRLVSLKCDLARLNEFRGKILRNTRVEHTIDPPDTPPSDSEPAARANTLEPSPAVRATSS